MNKRKILTAAIALLMAGSAQAQIFLEEESQSARSSYSSEEIGTMPYHQVEHDQANYVPVGSGIMLLTAIGGAYLIGKRKNERNK